MIIMYRLKERAKLKISFRAEVIVLSGGRTKLLMLVRAKQGCQRIS